MRRICLEDVACLLCRPRRIQRMPGILLPPHLEATVVYTTDPEDLDREPTPSKPPAPISFSGAFKLAVIAAVSVGMILAIEGVMPWPSSAVTPTTSPDRLSLAVSATGVPPISQQNVPTTPRPSTHPLTTAPPGPVEVLTGVIVGGVTAPPRIPVTRPAPAAPTPTPPAPAGFGTRSRPGQLPWPFHSHPGGGHHRFRPRGF
jgi:hypothetical protein